MLSIFIIHIVVIFFFCVPVENTPSDNCNCNVNVMSV